MFYLIILKVIECSDLPPTDWSTGLTDPFVKEIILQTFFKNVLFYNILNIIPLKF